MKKLLALLCAGLMVLSCFASYAEEPGEAVEEVVETVEEQLADKDGAEEETKEPEPVEEPVEEPVVEEPVEEEPVEEEPVEEEPIVEEPVEEEPVEEEPAEEKTTTFTVKFVDNLSGSETLIGAPQTVAQGESAVAPETLPEHAGYAFSEWDKSYANVQQDLTVVAIWEQVKCTVTFIDGHTNKQLGTVTVDYGASVTEKPDAPDHEGYVFVSETIIDTEGSAASLSKVTGDCTVYYNYVQESGQTAALGKTTIPTVKVGETVTLAYPIIVYTDSASYASNAKNGGSSTLDYSASRSPFEYSQSLVEELGITSFTLDIDTSDAGTLPFDAASLSKTATVVVPVDEDNIEQYGQYGAQEGQSICLGYAVFENMKVPKKGLENTYYTIPLIATWETEDGETYEATLSAQVQVTGVKTSSGSGYSSSTTPTATATPTAKLIIDSIRTEPENPSAGDTFDIILTLHNTSESLYLQNMELSFTTDEDALVPVSGSNLLYIPMIAQASTYEAVLHVRSKSDITSTDVKLNVEMEFEDSNLNALSANQSMVLNVKQVQKITLDNPVLPTGTLTANNSYDIEMGIYNAGRTTLYNVTAQLVCDNENFSTGTRFFAGNMESGTSKTVELEFVPLEEGEFTGNVKLTYETIDGEVTETLTPFSLYAMAEEEYDYDDFDDYSYEEITEDTTPTPAEIVGQLNPIVFALAGALLFIVIIAMGVSAKNKRKRAFEEDEMD